MVQCFPSPFPDELLYSLIARFAWQSLNNSPKDLSRQLFGNEGTKATIDLPSHINAFIENVPLSVPTTAEEIIGNNTLYPFYEPFLVESKRARILESMKGNHGSSVHTRVGINASKIVRPRYPKFCPLCLAEDLKKYTQAYWHRLHQIPDIAVCPYHNVFVLDAAPDLSELNYSYYLPPPVKVDPRWSIKENPSEFLFDIATQFKHLLNGDSTFNINNINYARQLAEKGYFIRGRIERESLVSDFKNFFRKGKGESLFAKLDDPEKWFAEIIRRPTHIFHPLRHVIVSEFLKQVENQQPVPARKPFGDGPWKCINKAARHYGERVVENIAIQVDRKSRREIATLTCGCGMIHTKSLIEKNGNVKEFIRVKKWGTIWQQKLMSCLNEKKSLRETARILGTDAKTVAIYSHADEGKSSEDLVAEVPFRKRDKWTQLLDQFDTSKVLKARHRNPALYSWLYRNDRGWLHQINSKNKIFNSRHLRLDWKKIDQDLFQQISSVVEQLTVSNFRGRVTRSLIAKIISKEKYLMTPNLKNLPKSKLFLDGITESREQFQARRIRIAAEEIISSGGRLVAWKIMRRACLRSPLRPQMKKALKQILSR